MLNVAPSKDFIEKMKAGHKKGKFGKMKKKMKMKSAKKGFKAFGKKQSSEDDSDMDGM